jgi:RimJ/RimL family protein N-acetyltransferase
VVLVTERLILRPFRPEDVPPYAALNSDPDTMQYLGGPRTAAQTEDHCRAANENLASRGFGRVAIQRQADGAFLGMCGLGREIWYPDDLEIGWRLLREARGQGFATEAARAWIDHGFDVLGLPRVISIADIPNVKSIAVMKRLGFTHDHTATLMDGDQQFEAVIYAVTREAWTAARTQ